MSNGNVILLTVDALRADHLSCYGYDRATTPCLDRLAENGAHFLNAFSASSHTREAVPALLTGRAPSEATNDGFALVADTIATHLTDTDCATGAFHSNPYASRAYGFDRDFDRFDDDLRLGGSKVIALAQRAFDKLRRRHYAPAETINERALDWMDSQDGRVFLWNHYMDPHGPYDPPTDYRRAFYDEPNSRRDPQKLYKRAAVTDPKSITDEERREMIDHYDGEIRYVDACIGEFLGSLEKRGALDDSLVIVTADHGDAFGEHGYYGHPRYLHDELVHVPMIARSSGLSNAEIEVPMSTLDVVPTILSFVGSERGDLPGVSIADVVDDPSRFDDRHVFSSARGENNNAHLHRFSVRAANGRCFLERDVKTGEIRSVDAEGCDTTLETALYEHSEERLTGRRSSPDTQATEPTEEVQRRLEALGYKGNE